MNSQRIQPPWEFLLSASKTSLQSYELSRLGHAANLRKEMTALLNQWLEENAAAMLARWLMEHREHELHAPQTTETADSSVNSSTVASDNIFEDSTPQRTVSRAAR